MTFWEWRAPMNRSCPANSKRRISFYEKAIHETIRSEGPITFDGHYVVRAASEADATRMVAEQCGMTLSGGFHIK